VALPATIHRVQVSLSDVDRGVYEELELRLARHPSESMRYLLSRLLAYCLSYEQGIEFAKGGLSSSDEPPISVWDMTGARQAWIDVGSPSAERLHKASKATPRVALYSHVALPLLRREAASRAIHRVEAIAVWTLDPAFLTELEPLIERNTQLELVRSSGQLYLTIAGRVLESAVAETSLIDPEQG
jgi:uncharacterized protein YaeQ